MSNCLLNVVAHNLRFYYTVDESIKDFWDVVFIIIAGQHKIVGSWSKGMTTSLVLTLFYIVTTSPRLRCFYYNFAYLRLRQRVSVDAFVHFYLKTLLEGRWTCLK